MIFVKIILKNYILCMCVSTYYAGMHCYSSVGSVCVIICVFMCSGKCGSWYCR